MKRALNDFGGFDSKKEPKRFSFRAPNKQTASITGAYDWFEAREKAAILLECAPMDLETLP